MLYSIVMIWILLCVLLWLLQGRLVFQPGRELGETPDDWGLSYEDVRFPAADGTRLHGWYVSSPRHRATVLFFHGNAGCIADRRATVGVLCRLGLDVFIFDYRGFGLSEGSPSEDGLYDDARGALAWLEKHKGLSAGDIVYMGRSLGGAVAARLASERPPARLVLESTFTSLPDMGAHLYPFVPVRLLARFRFDTSRLIGSLEVPKLIIHSPDDDVIPFEQGRTLLELAAPPKEFLEISGPHNGGFLDELDKYQRALDRFLPRGR